MRRTASVFALSLMVTTAAIAQTANVPKKDAPAAAPASTAVPEKVAPAAAKITPDGEKPFTEPNLKLPADSGGIVKSKIVLDAPLPDDFVMGKKTAELNIIEYASMSCPHCAHFATAVLPDIQKKYIDTGKVRYILRQFPLNEPALKGAMLMECLGEQDQSKYYVFAKVLFDAQNKWAFDANFLSSLETISSVGGVSKEQFTTCTSSTERESAVLKQQKLAKDELNVPHTPYIIVGNEVYAGDRTPEAIGKFIDKKLAELPKKKAAE